MPTCGFRRFALLWMSSQDGGAEQFIAWADEHERATATPRQSTERHQPLDGMVTKPCLPGVRSLNWTACQRSSNQVVKKDGPANVDGGLAP